MKIGLIGHGKTGSVIEDIAKLRGHEVPIIALSNSSIMKGVDVYIDFSVGDAVIENMNKLCDLKIPVVLGTTGWYDEFEKIKLLFLKSGNTCVWGGNFSIGVNIFYSIIKEASKKINKFNNEYDVMVHEFHHKNKVDSPGGTAMQIGNFILENFPIKTSIMVDKLDRKIEKNELHISSTRGGSIPGMHQVIFDSDFDTINLEHCARTREGFAFGAVIMAEKIRDLKPGFYNFAEIFDSIF